MSHWGIIAIVGGILVLLAIVLIVSEFFREEKKIEKELKDEGFYD